MPGFARPKLLVASLVAAATLLAATGAHAIDAEADRILRAMGEYLQSANEFSFHADITRDETLSTGEKVQYGAGSDLSVRRPDRLLVDTTGDERRRQVFYDGSTITLFDLQKNFYAVTDVPSKLDDAVDLVFEKFGFSVLRGDWL